MFRMGVFIWIGVSVLVLVALRKLIYIMNYLSLGWSINVDMPFVILD